MVFFDILSLFAAFILIGIGAVLVVNSIKRISRSLRIPAFLISFVLLGFLSTLPEISVGVSAVYLKAPQIFMGNLIGGVVILFLLVIPIYTISIKKIDIRENQITKTNLILTLLVIAAPALLIIDTVVTIYDSLIMITLYFLLVVNLYKTPGTYEKLSQAISHHNYRGKDIIKIFLGTSLILISSKLIVDKTILISSELNVSTFIISLIMVSIGTNMPELSLAVVSVVKKSKDVALGSYLGSAAFNTLTFGVLSLINGKYVFTGNGYSSTVLFLIFSLIVFYYLLKTQNKLTRGEAFILIFVYCLFTFSEIIINF